jgi:hypothetical protein
MFYELFSFGVIFINKYSDMLQNDNINTTLRRIFRISTTLAYQK